MTQEIWKSVKSYEGLYEISNLGEVRSLKHNTKKDKKTLKQYKIYGYCLVHLSKKGIQKNKRVHRLVAEAFISNPNQLPHVNHKDFNRENNKVDNLEWCTQSYNNKYSMKDSRRKIKLTNEIYENICTEYENGEYIIDLAKKYNVDSALISRILKANGIRKHKCKNEKKKQKVIRFDKKGNKIDEWDSISMASKELKINANHIGECCKGKYKSCGGYIWKYKGVESDDIKRR